MSVLHLEPERRESQSTKPRPEGSVGIGDYPLRRVSPATGAPLDVQIATTRPEPPRRRGPLARVLRWAAFLFLLVGLLGAGYCAWFYGEGRASQAYQGWRFDQITQHRATSVKAFVADYLARIPVVGAKLRKSPAVSNALADLWEFDQAVGRRAADLKTAVAGYLDRIPFVHSKWRGSWAVSAPPPSPQPPEKPPGAPPGAPRPSLAEGTLIGRLQVPRIGLSTIVLEGDSNPVLREAVGHIPSTPLPGQAGNVAIAGHRDTFFRALKDVHKNDSIVLATTAGTYRYRVQSVQVVGPDDTEVLAPSDHATLTLVTCYPFYFVGSAPKRYIVHADEIGSAKLAGQTPSPSQALSRPAFSSEVKVAFQAPRTAVARDGVERDTAHHPNHRSQMHQRSGRALGHSAGLSGGRTRKGRLANHPRSTEDPSPDPTNAQEQTGRLPSAGHRLAAWLRSLPKRATGNK